MPNPELKPWHRQIGRACLRRVALGVAAGDEADTIITEGKATCSFTTALFCDNNTVRFIVILLRHDAFVHSFYTNSHAVANTTIAHRRSASALALAARVSLAYHRSPCPPNFALRSSGVAPSATRLLIVSSSPNLPSILFLPQNGSSGVARARLGRAESRPDGPSAIAYPPPPTGRKSTRPARQISAISQTARHRRPALCGGLFVGIAGCACGRHTRPTTCRFARGPTTRPRTATLRALWGLCTRHFRAAAEREQLDTPGPPRASLVHRTYCLAQLSPACCLDAQLCASGGRARVAHTVRGAATATELEGRFLQLQGFRVSRSERLLDIECTCAARRQPHYRPRWRRQHR
jgi:hypothetical protein